MIASLCGCNCMSKWSLGHGKDGQTKHCVSTLLHMQLVSSFVGYIGCPTLEREGGGSFRGRGSLARLILEWPVVALGLCRLPKCLMQCPLFSQPLTK